MFSWIRNIWKSFKRLIFRKIKKDGAGAAPQKIRGQPLFITRISSYVLDKSLKVCNRRHPDIRIVTVRSFGDAYRHLLRICDQGRLTYRYAAGHYYYTVTLPGNYGRLVLTDNVGFSEGGIIAVMRIDMAELMPLVKEIRYILTK